jgi:multidrug efflux system outer membrane protein
MRARAIALPSLALSGLLLAGCAGLPPKPKAPVLPAGAPLAAPLAAPQAGGETTAAWPDAQWWRGFDDPVLDALEAQALAASPDMAAAQARIDAAAAGLSAEQAAGGPTVGAGASAVRQRLSDNGLFPPQFLGFHWYNDFQLGLKGTWSPDWWGKHRAEVAAAVGNLRAVQAEKAAAQLALSTSVASQYFGWQADAARAALALQRVDAATQALSLHDARAGAHIEREDLVDRARLDLDAARYMLQEGQTSLALRRVALAALAGTSPDELPPFTARPLPELPVGLPANASLDLIARRPDLAAARWRVESAARQRDVARTAFLPTLTLNGVLGLESLTLRKLVEAGSSIPQLGAQLQLPLFDSNTLHANYARSQADIDAAVAAYRGTLLTAAREVNGQLVTRQGLLAQSALRAQQLATAGTLRAAARARADAGLTDLLPSLAADDQWLAQQDAEILTHYALLGSELDLVRALGGGYRLEGTP